MNLPCNSCIHAKICTYKRQMETIKSAVDNLSIHESMEDTIKSKSIKDFDWIEPIQVNCKHYSYIHNNIAMR